MTWALFVMKFILRSIPKICKWADVGGGSKEEGRKTDRNTERQADRQPERKGRKRRHLQFKWDGVVDVVGVVLKRRRRGTRKRRRWMKGTIKKKGEKAMKMEEEMQLPISNSFQWSISCHLENDQLQRNRFMQIYTPPPAPAPSQHNVITFISEC